MTYNYHLIMSSDIDFQFTESNVLQIFQILSLNKVLILKNVTII